MEVESTQKLLKVIVKISETEMGTIFLSQFDDPSLKSEEFIQIHSLDESIKSNLIKFLHKQIKIRFGPGKILEKNTQLTKTHKKKSSLQVVTERITKHSYRYSKSVSKLASIKNYGIQLYEKGMMAKEKMRKKSECEVQQKESLLCSELTFRPKISKKSLKLVKNYKKVERAQKNKESMQKLLKNKDEREGQECYFVPSIIHRGKSESKQNIFVELYRDACNRRKNSQDSSKFSTSSSIFPKYDQKIKDMVERLSNSHKRTEEIIELMRRDAEANYDKETGQRLFIPVILNNSWSIREERSVWDELYNRSLAKN